MLDRIEGAMSVEERSPSLSSPEEAFALLNVARSQIMSVPTQAVAVQASQLSHQAMALVTP